MEDAYQLSPDQLIGFFMAEQLCSNQQMHPVRAVRQQVKAERGQYTKTLSINVGYTRFMGEFEKMLQCFNGVEIEKQHLDNAPQMDQNVRTIQLNFKDYQTKQEFLDRAEQGLTGPDATQEFTKYLDAKALSVTSKSQRIDNDPPQVSYQFTKQPDTEVSIIFSSETPKITHKPRQPSENFLKRQETKARKELGDEIYDLMDNMANELLVPENIEKYGKFVGEYIYRNDGLNNQDLMNSASKIRLQMRDVLDDPTGITRIQKLIDDAMPELSGPLRHDREKIAEKIDGLRTSPDFSAEDIKRLELAGKIVDGLEKISAALDNKVDELIERERTAEADLQSKLQR